MIELTVALAVLAILAVIAYPDLRAVLASNRLTAAANESLAMLQGARMEAIRSNQRAVACLSPDPDAASPICAEDGATGWIIFSDPNHSFQYDAGDNLIRVTRLPDGIQLRGSAKFAGVASFRSDGLARSEDNTILNAMVDVCLPVSEPAQNVRHISIGTGSRISISKASTPEACVTPEDES